MENNSVVEKDENNINIDEILNKCKDIGGYKDVKVINICEFTEKIFPDFFTNFSKYSERDKQIGEIIRNNKEKFHFYADIREDFSIYTAVKEAREKKKSCVIVEDMS